MTRDEVKEFIREVVGPNTLMIDSEKWVSLPCPLSTWTHDSGRDQHPSAGISVKPGDISIFNCFGCHRKGRLSYLLHLLEGYTGEDWGSLAASIERGEFYGGTIPEWGQIPDAPDKLPQPLDKETYIDLYDSAVGHPYLETRGITDAATRALSLLYDPDDGKGAKRIVFPVFDRTGDLYGFSGRAIKDTVVPKVKDYYGLPKRLLLLGAHLIQPHDEYIMLVEGLFDYAKMVTYGYPACAFMSSHLTEAQAEIVKDIGKPTYFFHDNDRAGREARQEARELLWRHIPLMKVRYPNESTVEMPSGDLRPPKDPAELLRDQVEEMLADARLL